MQRRSTKRKHKSYNKKDQGWLDRMNKQISDSKKWLGDNKNKDFNEMTKEQKKARINYLWKKARRYTNKLRDRARLQKMSETNLKEMMMDDIEEEANE